MKKHRSPRTGAGFSIVEMLVALTIGSVLISGSVYIYSQSRKTFAVSDTVARLQENGRYLFSVIEPDLQLAGHYGFTNYPNNIKFISGGNTGVETSALDMQTSSANAVKGLAAGAQNCGKNFAVDVIATVQGFNGADAAVWPLDCAAQGGGYVTGTDTLTIRRAAGPPADGIGAAKNGTLQLLVTRLSPTNGFMFADGLPPTGTTLLKDMVQVRDLIVRTYYISKDSVDPAAAGLPALRVKALGAGPTFGVADDVEIMRGVEDLQVQFGIDTGDFNGDGVIDADLDPDGDGIPNYANGTGTRYVNPDKLPIGFQVVSVRIWVLLRAEQAEQGFKNEKEYKYAGKTLKVNDSFRRVLMSRTIQLRNARTL